MCLLPQELGTPVSFIVGAGTSAATGWLGMMIAVRGNVRCAHAAVQGLNPALRVAFDTGDWSPSSSSAVNLLPSSERTAQRKQRADAVPEMRLLHAVLLDRPSLHAGSGRCTLKSMCHCLSGSFAGTVMGMLVVGLGLIGLSATLALMMHSGLDAVDSLRRLAGFGFGASSIALFARVGGGIYTKAADVGADLVGKVREMRSLNSRGVSFWTAALVAAPAEHLFVPVRRGKRCQMVCRREMEACRLCSL